MTHSFQGGGTHETQEQTNLAISNCIREDSQGLPEPMTALVSPLHAGDFLSLEQSTPGAMSSRLADLELLPSLGWTELPKLLYAIFTHMPLSNPVTALVCQAGLGFCLWSAVGSLFVGSRCLFVSPQENLHSLQEIFATCYGYILIFAHVYFVNNEKTVWR